MKIAVIGSGVSGLVAARLLDKDHDISLFESDARPGGHVHTVEVDDDGRSLAVDTGFIVFNDWTYPNFIKLLDSLGVQSQPSPMSFSVRCDRTGLEYCGSNLNGLFAQRANLLRWPFLRMLIDIIRFNNEAKSFLRAGDRETTMMDFLARRRFDREMVERYLVPMMAAIWSAAPSAVYDFPAQHFFRFFENHGLLNLVDRPQWRVVRGGSRVYVDRLLAALRGRIRLGSPVQSVRRGADSVYVQTPGSPPERFDAAVMAVHSDQALALLQEPSDREIEILGAIPYQPNDAVLHTDDSLMPRNRRAWASWNYHLSERAEERAALTYNMNMLQNLASTKTYLVTLNRSAEIDPSKVIARMSYSHPVYSPAAVAAQRRRGEIDGVDRIHYCGAYWGYGFHEDGVKSALDVAAKFGARLA